MFIEIDGLNIYYEQHGDPGSPHILLLHGWGSSVDAFRRIIHEFSGDYFLTAPDFPGFGKSEMIGEPWDAQKYADFTLKFIEKTALESPVLIGHSHGGRTIIKMTGTGMISPPKIVLIDPAGLIQKRTAAGKLRLLTYKTIRRILTLPLIRKFTKNTLEKARAHFGSADYKNAPEVLRRTLVRLVNEDLRGVLPNIKCPALLIWGENDTATPLADGQLMSKLIPDAGLCVIRGAGHFSFIEQPAQVHRILESFFAS